MKKTIIKVMVVMMSLCALSQAESRTETIFVSVNGNDKNSGSFKNPFATLQKAQQEARKVAGRKSVAVYLRAGTYYLPATLVLTAEDSGSKLAPVVYQAYGNERVVISGAVRLTDLKWKPYKDGIMQTKVAAGFATDQLFVDGELQSMARYPNFDPKALHYNGTAEDAIAPERAAKWNDPTGGFIHALHGNGWGGMHYVITGKGADNQVIYAGGWQNNRPTEMHTTLRFVENVFEELDSVGEWFLDSKKSLLYYCPAPGIDLAKATIETVQLKHLLEFRGTEQAPVRFVSFKGLTFSHAARTFMDTREPILRTDWAIYRGGALFLNATEDCTIEDCAIDQVGGNAVFVNNYNRRVAVRGCHISRVGGSGVAFIGDTGAVYNAVGWKGGNQLDQIDLTPGPKTANYPGECLVEDCLIHNIGQVEKQTAGVTVDMAQSITIRHCSIYDMPRAGINIGDGCWGGHLIEFCDVFDTVKETGDHGSFNSWGRDRFWWLGGLDLNDDKSWEANKYLVTLDACKTTVIRNSRWRCDHGWDIDLDDGSSNYHIINNLLLHGGLKNREGFFRVVENNILNNGFHPHVWYKHSQDIVRRNIIFADQYLPAGDMPETPWGKEMDYNLVHCEGAITQEPATRLSGQSKRDEHSIVADAMFIDPANGDYRVKEGSPALKLGFVNFPMDQFGVQKPELKAIARTPELPETENSTKIERAENRERWILQFQARDISGLGDRSAYGLPDESGVLILNISDVCAAAKAGLRQGDVIIACNDETIQTVTNLQNGRDMAAGKKLRILIIRKQERLTVELSDYNYAVTEALSSPVFKDVVLSPASDVLPVKIFSGGAATRNDPLESLIDGKIADGYGPVFANGVEGGMYKLDLSEEKNIAQINTFTVGEARARQNFTLYGSKSKSDPGWNVMDGKTFTPVISVDTRQGVPGKFEATGIRRSNGQPLGSYHWLVWVLSPISVVKENSAFQELQVLGVGVGGAR